MRSERLNKKQSFVLLIIIGVILFFVQWLIVLLPVPYLFNALLYGLTGYVLGNHLYYGKWRWGIVLALPVMIMILYFFASTNVATASSDIGLKSILDFFIIPTSACIGLWLRNNRKHIHSN
jgi:hypothetical protein